MKRLKYLPLVIVGIMTVGCSTRIKPGYVGIEVNAAGSNRGVSDYPIKTGRVWYNPYSTDILEWPTFVQNVVWTHNVDEGHPVNEELTFTTADKMAVSVDIALGYSLVAEKVPHFYVKFRTDDMNAFTHGFLRNLTREYIDKIGGRYKIDQIMGDNGPFLEEVKTALQKEVATYGVTLEQGPAFIGAPRPPTTVIDSINGTTQAAQNALKIQNEVASAEAEGRKKVASAEAQAKATLIYAEAESRANKMMAESLTPNLVELRRLEKWDGHLPQVSSSASPFVTLTNPGK